MGRELGVCWLLLNIQTLRIKKKKKQEKLILGSLELFNFPGHWYFCQGWSVRLPAESSQLPSSGSWQAAPTVLWRCGMHCCLSFRTLGKPDFVLSFTTGEKCETKVKRCGLDRWWRSGKKTCSWWAPSVIPVPVPEDFRNQAYIWCTDTGKILTRKI